MNNILNFLFTAEILGKFSKKIAKLGDHILISLGQKKTIRIKYLKSFEGNSSKTYPECIENCSTKLFGRLPVYREHSFASKSHKLYDKNDEKRPENHTI